VTELDVKVPFAFTAGKATLPAGTYSLTEAGESYVLIRGEKGGVFVPKSMIGLALDESGKVSLKFNRAGDKYVLQSAKAER